MTKTRITMIVFWVAAFSWISFWGVLEPLHLPFSFRDCGFGSGLLGHQNEFDHWWHEITQNRIFIEPIRTILTVFGVPATLYFVIKYFSNSMK